MQKKFYSLMTIGGGIGVLAAFLQTLEVLELLKNKNAVLACNINSIFSCSTVLNAPQSAVFGFPNSIMCLSMFLIFFIAGFAGLFSKGLNKGFRLTIQGLSIFTLCFGIWFLWQSTYVINAQCIFCAFCMVGLIFVNAAWVRINAADMPIGAKGHTWLNKAIAKQYDILAWGIFAVAGALAITLHFMQ